MRNRTIYGAAFRAFHGRIELVPLIEGFASALEGMAAARSEIGKRMNMDVKLGPNVLPPKYAPIYGLNVCNADGIPREKILRRCEIGEKLKLVNESGTKKSSAIKVCRASGEMLGYLKGPVADDLIRRMENGLPVGAEIVEFWYQGLFRRVHRTAEGTVIRKGKSAGAINYMQRVGCFIKLNRYSLG